MRQLVVLLALTLFACGDDGINELPDAPTGDTDGDGVDDVADNCPDDANADQADLDADGQGDACDNDDDGDSILDAVDNCPIVANTDQSNVDGDADGDACDDDADGDTILNAADNCPIDANTDQANLDGDTEGDACDPDDDNDTILDNVDNCPTVENSDQANSDDDTLGNACDDDDDNDGLLDVNDNCPSVANLDQSDLDGDGIGDACDGIFPTLSETLTGGNLIAVGKGWSGREDATAKADGDITIVGIPAGSTIFKAFYYWTTIGTPFPSITFQGNRIQGTEIGQAEDTCWGIGNNFMYRADVTAMVTGDDTYTVRDILSTTDGGPDGQGGSLVIVYQDPGDTRDNFVKVSDGAIGFVGNGTTTVTTTIDNFTLGADPDKVSVFNVVADGQDFPETLTIQGTEFGAGDPFSGNDGPLWDTRVDDATGLVLTGATEITTDVFSANDCLAWSMNAVVIENFVAAANAIPKGPGVSTTPASKLVTSRSETPIVRPIARPRPQGSRGSMR